MIEYKKDVSCDFKYMYKYLSVLKLYIEIPVGSVLAEISSILLSFWYTYMAINATTIAFIINDAYPMSVMSCVGSSKYWLTTVMHTIAIWNE